MEIKGYDVTSISELKIDPDVVTLCITDCPVVDFAGLSALKELEYQNYFYAFAIATGTIKKDSH